MEFPPHHLNLCYLLLLAHSTPTEADEGPSYLLENIKTGEYVLTSGGIYGKITGIKDNIITVEISDKVRVKVNRGNIAGVVKADVMKPD